MPNLMDNGYKSGTMMMMAEEPSINMPAINRMTFVSNKNVTLVTLADANQFPSA